MRIPAIILAGLALAIASAAPARAADAAALDGAYAAQAAAHPELVTRTVYGHSRGGRELTAYRVGHGAERSRPVVLYAAAQDGGDEIAAAVQQRLFAHVVAHAGDAASGIPAILAGAELWFVAVVDPDGYDGAGSGVAFDRNWSHRWGFDREGASDAPGSPDYRGPHAGSEPEVAALGTLLDRLRPRHLLDYRAGDVGRIVYPESWQVLTPATDAPALAALAGADDDHPAIAGYSPGPAGELAIANGTLIDTAYHRHGTQAFSVQIPDSADETVEFAKGLAFALDLARSAPDPSQPVSHLGTTAPDFVAHTFPLSYGNPQTVEVSARRALGAVRVHWRTGGRERSSRLRGYSGGERYGAPGAVYQRLRGSVDGFSAGDTVEVWFEGGGRRSAGFTFTAAVTTPGEVLVLAAEDYTGTHPGPAHPGPEYLSAYTDALSALDIAYDVYDVDARDRRAPDALGVLSHYETVIWYTGDDIFVREPDQPANRGTSRLFGEQVLAARDYLNDGGKLLVSGQQALQGAWAQLIYDPVSGYCAHNNMTGTGDGRCVPVADDFLQYYLGAWASGPASSGAPLRAGATAFSLENQFAPSRYLATSSVLDPDAFPLFASTRYAGFDRVADFEPASGTHYGYAASRDESYQRLTRTVDLTGATSGSLRFAVSYDTDPGYDFVFVEAREAGQGDWTTLPDANGHTSDDTGDSCSDGWVDLHPQIARYQAGDCSPTGTTGAWHAATGDSAGFQTWDVDLSAWAGKQVEVSIVYAQDWATSGLGAYVDDVRTLRDGAVVETQDFEQGLGAWQADGWTARAWTGVVEGLGIATADTLLWGFGLEGVHGAETRERLLGDALQRLNPNEPVTEPPQPPPPPPPAPTPPPAAPPAREASAMPKLVVGRALRPDRRGRVKVRVRCASRVACTGVLKLVRGRATVARRAYALRWGRSGTVTLKLTKSGLRSRRLTLKLYRGSGHGARIVATHAVSLRRG